MPAAAPRSRWSASILISFGAAVAVGLIVLAFLWPVATASPKDVPLGLVGTSTAIDQVKTSLDDRASGVFATRAYDSRADAVTAIRQRHVYGAIVSGTAPEVLVASAASPAVATVLKGIAQGMQEQISAGLVAAHQSPTAVRVTTTDVVPLVAADANGTGMIAIAFPIVLGGMIGGIAISLLVVGVGRRLLALAISSIVAGVAVTLIAHTWFGILPGGFVALACGLTLAMLGTGSFIVGLSALLGTRGIPIAAVVTMLIGNPLSAASVPVPFLAQPWGAIGQYFVPGAAATLVRDLSYFPDADTTQPWLVLVVWAAAGVLLSALGHFRDREVVHVPALDEPAVGLPAHSGETGRLPASDTGLDTHEPVGAGVSRRAYRAGAR